MATNRVLTIGYGGRTLVDVISQLHDWNVEFVLDVRSSPYSRYQPEFSEGPLAKALAGAGLRYGLMGHQLGGRPDDPSCYTANGNVDYDECRKRPLFRQGIARLRDACERGYNACLLCSEGNPKDCHRSALIGEALAESDLAVVHLLPNGGHKIQSAVMQDRTGGQLSFIGEVSRKAIPDRREGR